MLQHSPVAVKVLNRHGMGGVISEIQIKRPNVPVLDLLFLYKCHCRSVELSSPHALNRSSTLTPQQPLPLISKTPHFILLRRVNV